MKLSVTLSLALATACSAFAPSPTRPAGVSTPHHHQPAAFVRPAGHAGLAQRDVSLRATSLAAATGEDVAAAPRGGGALGSIDIPLLIYFALWYLGNYYYNITNKLALKATGGAAGFPMTISALQLGIGSLYGIFLWLAPDARKKPTITMDDVSSDG